MSHPKLLAGWVMPPTPSGYAEPVAVEGAAFEWRADFVSWEPPGFASQDINVPAAALPTWPWQAGFEPKSEDWQSIGFFPFD